MKYRTQLSISFLGILAALPCVSFAGGEGEAPLSELLEALPEDVRVYNDHLVTLASPWMEGRVPGSRGMELAKEYCEYWYKDAGLEPAFGDSFRQPFDLAPTRKLRSEGMGMPEAGMELVAGEDFTMLSIGSEGTVTGHVVFVGYSIEKGPVKSKYKSYGEDDDLSGKIAVMFRFEPMDYQGKSMWGGSPWTARAGFRGKVRAAAKRGAIGVVIVQTPGADDERVKQLTTFSGGGGKAVDIPVAMVTLETGEKILKQASTPYTLMDLRVMADESGGLYEAGGLMTMECGIDSTSLQAENVGALLPGKGELADELVVIGAHLDHLGMGNFGSRDGENAGKKLHPGADDNASGSAALLMLADKLKASYDALPEGTPARSLLFLSFSGEESGLNGSRHYVKNPIRDMDQHALMINFDMIGRIVNGRLSVSGAQTGEGLQEFLAPFYERTPLDIVQPENLSGASDHTPFLRKQTPVLFGIIADFHQDYHTSRDVSSKINRVGAVQTIELFHEVTLAASIRAERFEFQGKERSSRIASAEKESSSKPTARGNINVRFGIAPASYGEGTVGVGVGSVTAGSSAEEAGVQEGDLLTKWNGEEIGEIKAWVGMLSKNAPGDKVQVTLHRDGEDKVLWVTLKGLTGEGQ